MFKLIKKSRIISTIILAFSFMLIATTVWAAISYLESQDSNYTSLLEDNEDIGALLLEETTTKSKARAPEPSTLALFCSGLIGMIFSFIRKTYAVAKRFLDIFLSLIAIIMLSPLFLFAIFLIKLTSKGPIIFTQVRVGKDGKLFNIYKFRTMRVNAEKETGPVWASKDDPRLIPVGSFLRKAHIDEIPQFFNVLKGEMSVIGPRPERPIFVEQFKKEISDYENRLKVKPGITGLAQVWHRYDETIKDVRKKIKYDLLYIRKVCLWTDVRILLRTVRVVFTGEGAR